MRATAYVLSGALRPAADCFYRHRRRGYTALGMSWVTGAALKPHAGSSDGDTAIGLLSEVVTWLVLARVVCEEKRDEKLGLRRPCFFF